MKILMFMRWEEFADFATLTAIIEDSTMGVLDYQYLLQNKFIQMQSSNNSHEKLLELRIVSICINYLKMN
ncbi:hypothetical protein pb186bvf_008290 [Paramecium bursaria]